MVVFPCWQSGTETGLAVSVRRGVVLVKQIRCKEEGKGQKDTAVPLDCIFIKIIRSRAQRRHYIILHHGLLSLTVT